MALPSNGKLEYCNIKQCKICRLQVLDTNTEFVSNLAIKKFKFTGEGSCKSKDCVYMISCRHPECQMKYVGFTTTPLNKRLAGHRANIVNHTEGVIMFNHFTRVHGITDMIIKPLEFCDKEFIRAKEKFWMQELNTIFPYGLNNRIDIKGIHDAFQHTKSNSNIPIYSLFNTVKNNRTKRGGGTAVDIDAPSLTFEPEEFISEIDNSNSQSIANKCRKEIMKLKVKVIYKLLLFVTNQLISSNTVYSTNEYLLFVIRDLCLYRILTSNPKSKIKYDQFVTFSYANRLLDKINISKLIHSNGSRNLYPANDYLSKTGVSFQYSNTIRSKVTNYKESVCNFDNNIQCSCDNYRQFIDIHHGHVITGDLNIINNGELKDLFQKGLNFREKQPQDILKTKNSIQSAIDSFIFKASNSLKLPIKAFSPWKLYILKAVNSNLVDSQDSSEVSCLKKKSNFNDLKELHKQFVIVPVDKASANIGIICKAFYLQVLTQEIVNSGNYEPSNYTQKEVMDEYRIKLNQIGDQTEYANNLPFMYWLPKFHKTPIGPRFITSGRYTCINGLSKILSSCLKSLLEAAKIHSNFIHKFDKTRDFLITDSNKMILEYISAANLTNCHKSLKTYDFQTLYTKIPQTKLKDNLKEFIHNVFIIKKSKYINVRSKNAIFSDNRTKTGSFTENELIAYLNYSIDNTYILFKGEAQRQAIGIPMGSNDALHLANIFLHVYEKSFYQECITNNQRDVITKLGDIYRYQDDLIAFGFQDQHNVQIQDIYPNEMVISNTNITSTKVTYLDLEIEVRDGKYFYKSFDKRKNFNFPIVKYPNLNGNIPINPAYGVYISQLIRFCDINMLFDDFKCNTNELVKILLQQGYKYNMLRIKFKQFAKDNVVRWAHFGVNFLDAQVIDNLFKD